MDEIDKEVEIRLRMRKRLMEEDFERRVELCMGMIRANASPDWPYSSLFDDGGTAWHEAKKRIAIKSGGVHAHLWSMEEVMRVKP